MSFTRNTDIKIRAFIRPIYMRGFAGVNNHNAALYMIRSWDLHLLDLQEQKQVAVFLHMYLI